MLLLNGPTIVLATMAHLLSFDFIMRRKTCRNVFTFVQEYACFQAALVANNLIYFFGVALWEAIASWSIYVCPELILPLDLDQQETLYAHLQ